MMKNVLVILSLMLLYMTGTDCIKCYQCSSAEDPEGEDNCGAYDNFHREKYIAVECNTDESKTPGTFCMKRTTQGPRGYIWDGRWRQVIRSCASVAENGVTGVCNWGVQGNGVYWEECYCSENGCNSTETIKLAMGTQLLVIIAICISSFTS